MYAGLCNHNLGQYEEALVHFDISISKNDKEPKIYFNRGSTYTSLQKFDLACADFSQAITKSQEQNKDKDSKDPSLGRYYFNLGITQRRIRHFSESVESLKTANDLAPKKAAYLNNLGLSYF